MPTGQNRVTTDSDQPLQGSKEVGGVEPSTIAKVTPLQKQEKKRTQSEFDRFDGLDLGDFGDLDAASQRVHESLQRQVGSRLLRC